MRRLNTLSTLLFLCIVLLSCGGRTPAEPQPGIWHAWLDSPGGPLPFEMQIERTEAGYRVSVINGDERIEVPRVEVGDEHVVLGFDHYDSTVLAMLSSDGRALDGAWRKNTGSDLPSELAFHAVAGLQPRFSPPPSGTDLESAMLLNGRWGVRFAADEEAAIGIFEADDDATVRGTFLTTTGDYRYLAGDFSGGVLRLSCFDGAHAFLFHARLGEDHTLAGDFWSRDSYHDTWTASRNESAALPDAFSLTLAVDGVDLSDLTFPDLDGRPRSLGDPALAGPARVVEIFGSWCPNCNDATAYLVELHQEYADRGLVVVGLAYELSGEFERDAGQVQAYIDHHDIPYTVLVAGRYGKDEASRSFPLIDRIRAFPTTIFLDRNGRVRAVHTGFAGPATGEAHRLLREEFEDRIELLLEEGGR